MNHFFKTLLLWLLVAVLPLHAVGAAMPMSCDPLHHETMPAASRGCEHGQPLRHDRDRHAEDRHHAGMAMQDGHHDAGDAAWLADASADAGMADDASSSSGVSSHAGSSTCMAGCIGAAALPSLWNSTFALGGSEAVAASPAPLIAGHTPAGLDRPPRPISA